MADPLADALDVIRRHANVCSRAGEYDRLLAEADRIEARASGEGTAQPDPKAHTLTGDLGWLEYAIADYIAKWGEHWTGQPYLGEFGPNIAGMPTAMANMAMTVIHKNLGRASGEGTAQPDDEAIYNDVKTELGIALGWGDDSDPDDVRDWRHDLVTRIIRLTERGTAPQVPAEEVDR